MPSSHRELFPSADENQVLEALERFQREIQKARWSREQAVAEFDRFIEGFQVEPERAREAAPDAGHVLEAPPRPPAGRATPRHHPIADFRSQMPRSPQVEPVAAPAPAPEAISDVRPQIPQLPDDDRAIVIQDFVAATNFSHFWEKFVAATKLTGARLVIALVLAAVAIAAVLAIWRGDASQSPTAATPVSRTPPPTAVSAAPAPATKPAAPAAAPAATLTTTRPVWVRVTIDGRRLFERELPAGASIPLDGKQGILIRAGDAGAVRITFADGRSEMLGATGQVVTKRYALR